MKVFGIFWTEGGTICLVCLAFFKCHVVGINQTEEIVLIFLSEVEENNPVLGIGADREDNGH